MLKIDNLSIIKSNQRLFGNLNLNLNFGDILQIDGKNGSGKTSFLKVLADIAIQKDGTHNSKDFDKLFLPASGGMREELTSLQVTKFFLNSNDDFASSALTEMGLKEKINTPIFKLSEGQKKRVMMTRIKYSHNNLLLLDEPFNALDKTTKKEFAEMLSIFSNKGGIVLIATHIPLKIAFDEENIPREIYKKCQPTSELRFDESFNNGWNLKQSNDVGLSTSSIFSYKDKTKDKKQFSEPVSSDFNKHLERELKLLISRPADIVWPQVFFLMLVTVLPFGIGYDKEILRNIAAGILYTSVFLVMTVYSSRLFEPEKNCGALEQIISSEKSLVNYCTVKSFLFWAIVGLPLSLVAIPLAFFYNMDPYPVFVLAIGLAIGSLGLTMMLTLFSALALMARQAQMIIGLLAFPSIVPVLIFGSAAVRTVLDGQSPINIILVLLGISLLTLLIFPKICALLLEISLE